MKPIRHIYLKFFKHGRLLFFLAALIFCLQNFDFDVRAQAPVLQPKSFQFNNGQWFNGKSFKRRTFYSVNGFLTMRRPARIDEIVDLKNGFVIPPLADAHCHNFDGAWNIKQQVEKYLHDGVFYAKVQTDVRSGANEVSNKVNIPSSVDVSYAHGALTHTYGHGIEVYEGLALGLFGNPQKFTENIPKIAASRLRDNDAYYIIDTEADLESKWQRILDGKPDFIKIYLLTSEDFEEKLRNIPNIPLGSIGLDPKLVPLIVRKAHAAHLRVSAHIDTVTDYRIALSGGVDEMAHIPGYYIGLDDNTAKYQLNRQDAETTARRKVWVIPAPIFYPNMEQAVREKTDAVLKQNLKLLKQSKVRIAFGSDRYGDTPVEDVFHIMKLGVFSNLELLEIWCEDTPQTIFPNHKIGFLKNGYEASFIVLGGNPVQDFGQVKNIVLRFKQGQFIN